MFFYHPSKEMLWGNALRRKEADWLRVGKKGTLVDRKADAEIAQRLNDALSGKRKTK